MSFSHALSHTIKCNCAVKPNWRFFSKCAEVARLEEALYVYYMGCDSVVQFIYISSKDVLEIMARLMKADDKCNSIKCRVMFLLKR